MSKRKNRDYGVLGGEGKACEGEQRPAFMKNHSPEPFYPRQERLDVGIPRLFFKDVDRKLTP